MRITSSEIRQWLTCRKKWWFRYNQLLVPIKKQDALTFGSLVHKALEAAYTDKDWLKAIDLFEGYQDPEFEAEEAYRKAMAEAMVEGYLNQGYLEKLGHVVVACEYEFSVPLITPCGRKWPRYMFSGKIDLITEDEYDNIYLWDFKTGSKGLDSEWAQLDLQMENYLWAMSQELDFPALHIVYSQLRKPTIKPNDVPMRDELGRKIILDTLHERVWIKDQEKPRQVARKEMGEVLLTRPMTSEEFYKKISDDIAKRPDFYYENVIIVKTQNDLDKVQSRLWEMAHDIGHRDIVRNPNSCQIYGCAYRELCVNDNTLSRRANYEIREAHEELLEKEGDFDEESTLFAN